MDDDVRQALDEMRQEMRELARARTPAQRSSARDDVREAREDLEDVLRREGYQISRRQLDELLEQEDERKFNARMEKFLADRAAADEADEDDQDDDGEGANGKPKPKRKPKPKAGATVVDEEAEEWS